MRCSKKKPFCWQIKLLLYESLSDSSIGSNTTDYMITFAWSPDGRAARTLGPKKAEVRAALSY